MIEQRDWLAQAKRLAVGMRMRVRHDNERRANMIIANEQDRWWCYCQACKDGGIERKEHVMLGAHIMAPPDTVLQRPADLFNMDSEYGPECLRFLASKCMDMMYIPDPVYYSPSRRRLIIDTHGGLGRDITNKAPAKWLAYSKPDHLGETHAGRTAIVVEDAFSWYKVRYAMRDEPVDVICALGTGVHDPLVIELLRAGKVLWMFDGDAAGASGAWEGSQRMRALGVPSQITCAPLGKDPKDLSCGDIRDLLRGVQL